MELAILSDVHSNYVALETCLKYALSQNISRFIFLGDYVGELAYPERTMQLLYDLKENYECYFVKGNKEDYWLRYRAEGEQGWKDRDSTTGALLYAYHSLLAEDFDFFEKLPSVRELKLYDLPPITLCHGSPFSTNQKMLPDNIPTDQAINHTATPIILCGHTHVQRKFVHNEKYVLNPGSLGLPIGSEGKAQFMTLHAYEGKWIDKFISLKYNVDSVIREMYEVKLDEHAPYWSRITEQILLGGNISHGTVLSRAMEINREMTGKCVWPYILEECWEQAFHELIR